MNRFLRLFCILPTGLAISTFAQGVSSPAAVSPSTPTITGTTGVDVAPSNPEIAAIPAAIRLKADTAHAHWLAQGATEFFPKYTYAGGAPTLMLMVPINETPAALARRQKLMVQACEFMVADDTFDHAVICIATYDPNDRSSMAARNIAISRAGFQSAVTRAANAPTVSNALAAIYTTPAAVGQICAALGLR